MAGHEPRMLLKTIVAATSPWVRIPRPPLGSWPGASAARCLDRPARRAPGLVLAAKPHPLEVRSLWFPRVMMSRRGTLYQGGKHHDRAGQDGGDDARPG
jgi:hypothetical protein